jgi:hypothetical protein
MSKSALLSAGTLVSTLFLSGIAVAQQDYSRSGPAAGSDVKPSTAIQKEYEGRSADGDPLRQASCPVTHTTILVRIFGDTFCTVKIPKSIRVMP